MTTTQPRRRALPLPTHGPHGSGSSTTSPRSQIGLLPLDEAHALLVSSHPSLGISVTKVAYADGGLSSAWRAVEPGSRYDRRITGATAFGLTGPAAGAARLRTTTDPSGRRALGGFTPRSGCVSPWGTVLSGEAGVPRRGPSTTGPHGPYRTGWIVEIDPFDQASTPRKHTMLGRFDHASTSIEIAPSGHAVVHMGDGGPGGHRYSFVSADTFDPRDTQAAKLRNLQLLTRGTLHVARHGAGDDSSTWLALTSDTTSYVEGMSIADVLIDPHRAADEVAVSRLASAGGRRHARPRLEVAT